MWVDYDGRPDPDELADRLVQKPGAARAPNVAVSVLDPTDPWRRLSISGHVSSIRDDEGLAFINAMSMRYVGRPIPSPGRARSSSSRRIGLRAFMGRADPHRRSDDRRTAVDVGTWTWSGAAYAVEARTHRLDR